MLAARCHAAHDIRIDEVEPPGDPGPGDRVSPVPILS